MYRAPHRCWPCKHRLHGGKFCRWPGSFSRIISADSGSINTLKPQRRANAAAVEFISRATRWPDRRGYSGDRCSFQMKFLLPPIAAWMKQPDVDSLSDQFGEVRPFRSLQRWQAHARLSRDSATSVLARDDVFEMNATFLLAKYRRMTMPPTAETTRRPITHRLSLPLPVRPAATQTPQRSKLGQTDEFTRLDKTRIQYLLFPDVSVPSFSFPPIRRDDSLPRNQAPDSRSRTACWHPNTQLRCWPDFPAAVMRRNSYYRNEFTLLRWFDQQGNLVSRQIEVGRTCYDIGQSVEVALPREWLPWSRSLGSALPVTP